MGHAAAVTDQSFEQEVLRAPVPVLVDFWAEWCGPCRSIAPSLDQIAAELGARLKVVKVDIDENPNVPAQFGVQGIPTLLLFKEGQVVEKIVGAYPKAAMLAKISPHL